MEIYLVLSQTGTILSRLLKVVTGASYNHISISLNRELDPMYSFGRRHPYNPIWGGFVLEGANFGTFKRFSNTNVVVLALSVSPEQYKTMEQRITNMLAERTRYKYDALGLVLAGLHIVHQREYYYYCSGFVRELLVSAQVPGAETLEEIPQPIHFLSFPGARKIYSGLLREYAAASK